MELYQTFVKYYCALFVARSVSVAFALCLVPQKLGLALELGWEARGGKGTTRVQIFL